MEILLVAGARPNFVKIAAVRRALEERGLEPRICHTGQHYDDGMSAAFFRDLGIPAPDYDLGVGSAPHAVQIARIMEAFDGLLARRRFDVVVVVGDVNSTVACALTAAKRGVPVAHVEAGLRSFDRSMPEELNRILTDAVSDIMFTPSREAGENLLREGRPGEAIRFVGNVMVDTLDRYAEAARSRSAVLVDLGVAAGEYAVLTLHRPANVDGQDAMARMLDALDAMAREIPVVYPVHPRSRAALDANGLAARAAAIDGLTLVDPLGYLDFVALESQAAFVMTDSGGVQEETTVLGVPCLTLRPNTERPVTVTDGTNTIVGSEPTAVAAAAREQLASRRAPSPRRPELWDGRASERIADTLVEWKRR